MSAPTSARLVASLLSTVQVSGKRIVEVGSGTGAAGLLLAKAGGCVVLTDLDAVVPLLASNASHTMGYEKVRTAVDGDGCAPPEAGCVVVGSWDFGKPPPEFVRPEIAAEEPVPAGTDQAEGQTPPVDAPRPGVAAEDPAAAAQPAVVSPVPAAAAAAQDDGDNGGTPGPDEGPGFVCGPSAARVAALGETRAAHPHFVVGSDVLYAEALIGPLLDGVASLLGPSSVAILANERRCEVTYASFLEACRSRFVTRLVPRRQMPPDAPESMYIVELRRKRR